MIHLVSLMSYYLEKTTTGSLILSPFYTMKTKLWFFVVLMKTWTILLNEINCVFSNTHPTIILKVTKSHHLKMMTFCDITNLVKYYFAFNLFDVSFFLILKSDRLQLTHMPHLGSNLKYLCLVDPVPLQVHNY